MLTFLSVIMNDFAKFLSINNLKRKDIASFLGVSGAFITQICSGDRPLPEEKLALIKANAYGWDISMLTHQRRPLELLDSIRGTHREVTPEKIKSAIKEALSPDEKFLIGYLERKVKYLESKIDEKDALIYQLYQQIGMLETKLELARKGEIASVVGGSSDADAV